MLLQINTDKLIQLQRVPLPLPLIQQILTTPNQLAQPKTIKQSINTNKHGRPLISTKLKSIYSFVWIQLI